MSEIKQNPINTDHFTICKDSKEMVTEASDLQGLFRFHQIYDDACDEGLTFQSSRTNRQENFYLAETKRDGDGDIMWWLLLPTTETVRRNPRLKDWKVRIFND